jgi:hypothetical protein
MTITKEFLKALREDVNAALDAIGKKHGVSMLAKSARIDVALLELADRNASAFNYHYQWAVEGGSVLFGDVLTEIGWATKVLQEFSKRGYALRLVRKLGPYVVNTNGGFGGWILVHDDRILKHGTELQKAVVKAANHQMEIGDDSVLTMPSLFNAALELEDKTPEIKKITSVSPVGKTWPGITEVMDELADWRKAHTWEEFK